MKHKNYYFASFIFVLYLFLCLNKINSQTITHTTGTGGFQTVSPYNGVINLPTFDPFLGELTQVEFDMSVDVIMLGSTYEISNYTFGTATLEASGANAFIHDFSASFYGAALNESTTLTLTGSDDFKGPTPANYFVDVSGTPVQVTETGDRAIAFLAENSCAAAISANTLATNRLWDGFPFSLDGYLATVVGTLPTTPPIPIFGADFTNPIPADVNDAQICVEQSFSNSKIITSGLDDFKKCFVNDFMQFSENVSGTPNFSYGSLVLDPTGDFTARVGIQLRFQSNYTIKYTYTPAASIPNYTPGFPGCVALNAEILDFKGTINPRSNLLEWTSLQHGDFSHFEVERSRDMQNWEKIADIKKKDNSPATYFYEDKDITQNLYYYRLKIIDQYGNFAYLDDIVALHNRSIQNTQNILDVNVYPNPTHNILNLQLPNADKCQVYIKDIQGKTVWQGVGSNNSPINIESLKAGTYILEVIQANQIFHKRVIKN